MHTSKPILVGTLIVLLMLIMVPPFRIGPSSSTCMYIQPYMLAYQMPGANGLAPEHGIRGFPPLCFDVIHRPAGNL